MNKKILIAGLLVSVMLLVPINSAYSNNGLSVKYSEKNLLRNTMLDDTWVKTYDYDNGYYNEFGHSVCQTTDGGYIVAAESNSWQGYINDWIFKTDSKGNIIWDRTYTVAPQKMYYARDVIETNDNYYIITGTLNYNKVWLLKLDTNGNKIWSNTYDVKYCGYEAIQTFDGGYAVVVGSVGYDISLLKTDSNGNLSWVKTYDNDEWDDIGESLKQTSDGGYIIVGYTYLVDGFLPKSTWLIKTDENGTLLWDKKYNGNGIAVGVSVDIGDDGGYFITGYTRTNDDILDDKIWILKIDENGEKLWEKIYGKANSRNCGNSVIATYDGGCVVAGQYQTFFRGVAILIKLDSLGNIEWSKTWSTSSSQALKQTTDGGYILTGYYNPTIFTNGDAFLIKTDSNGNAPPLSKTKDIGIRNRVFDGSLLRLLFEKLLDIWRFNLL